MNIDNAKRIYFIGIGGIGMSALARYFKHQGVHVSGYDRVRTALTRRLEREGIPVLYDEDVRQIDREADVVVYTPAVPVDSELLSWYREHGALILKRSDVLQAISRDMKSITVAGTHGKTTVSTLIAHILRDSGRGCNAFLGGIATNYDTNFWPSEERIAVIEADEYDRSFLKLAPQIAVLTSMDPDHLDIYGTKEAMEEAFVTYTRNIRPDGTLWYKFGLDRGSELTADHKCNYSLQNSAADAYASSVRIDNGGYCFDAQGPGWWLPDVQLHLGGMHNVENCIAAIAVAKTLGIDDDAVKRAVASFKGVKRRFEYVVHTEQHVYIDDYAHHPRELESLIHSVKVLFPDRRCVVAFQPHLFSRTRDFAADFARSLDLADQVILLEIYPAREKPIEGVSAAMIRDAMGNPNCTIMTKDGLLEYVAAAQPDLLVTAGAGDIDQCAEPIKNILTKGQK